MAKKRETYTCPYCGDECDILEGYYEDGEELTEWNCLGNCGAYWQTWGVDPANERICWRGPNPKEGWVIADPMDGHKCKKIAQVPIWAGAEGRDMWLGELLEPIPNHPAETHCLHITTPFKNIVFGVMAGDAAVMAVFAQILHDAPINQRWINTMEDMYRKNCYTRPRRRRLGNKLMARPTKLNDDVQAR